MPDKLIVEKKDRAACVHSRRSIPLLQSAKQRQASLVKSLAILLIAAVASIYLGQTLIHQFSHTKPQHTQIPAHCRSRLPYLSRSPPSLACRIEHAIAYHKDRLVRQSRSVEEAVRTYEQRYKRKPPKRFETWAEFALQHHSPLIDDFDQIDVDLAPFRKQKTIKSAEWRQRMSQVKRTEPGEMLGSLSLIDGAAIAMGPEAGSMSSDTLESLIHPIAPLLPDMTVLYNWYAEPRLLSSKGKKRQGRPSGGNDYRKIGQKSTDDSHEVFGNFTQRNTLRLLAQSCPSTTLATSSFLSSIGGLPLRNLCRSLQKSLNLDTMHGFFAAPDAFYPTYTLVPLLSRAKLSTFDDILAPNVCYGHQDYRYWNEYDTLPFSGKSRSVYWRGSMTGISTTSSNWVNGHRHRLVGYIQAIRAFIDGQAGKEASKILSPSASLDGHIGKAPWTAQVRQALSRMSSSDVFDVAFVAAPPKCPKDVCNAIKKEMPLQKEELVDASFQHQYVLDLDGQSMSCRFYSLLESNSVVLKQTIWGEWHDERLIPWLHYVPIDIDLSKHEIPLYLDWFINTSEGRRYGDLIAKESRKWTEASLRKIDLTIYLFRLLIELADIMSVN
jgi:hypothetical protein